MAKKSRKRPTRPKDSAGCMSGLISIFDFRQGRFTQKLLPERKGGSSRFGGSSRNRFDVLSNLEEKHDDLSDTDGKEAKKGEKSKASIKVLVEEEMSKSRTSKKIPSAKVEQLKAELGFGTDVEKNRQKRQHQNYKVESNRNVNHHGASQSSWSDTAERSSFDVNLAELMVEFCRKNHECQEKLNDSSGEGRSNSVCESDDQFAQKNHLIQKALSDITEALLTQNAADTKHITDHGVAQPKEFMEALDMLDSNRDVFIKLLRDPNSLIFKHILNLQDAQIQKSLHEGDDEDSIRHSHSQKHSRHSFFKRRDKSDGEKASNESSSQALKRIVVLKPSPARFEQCLSVTSPISSPKSLHNLKVHDSREKAHSHFSIKEIKRRLRNVIGESKKERDLITRDGILHKIPYGPRKNDENSRSGRTSKLSALLKGGDDDADQAQLPQKQLLNTTDAHPLYRGSDFYEEARKRLIEMITSDNRNEVSSPRQISKSLSRILSLPGYYSSSPLFSPGRDNDFDSPRQRRSSPLQKVKRDNSTLNVSSSESTDSFSCSDNNPDDVSQATSSKQTIPESHLNFQEEIIQNKSNAVEEGDRLDKAVEVTTDEHGSMVEQCNNDVSSLVLKLEPSEEASPPTPSDSSSTKCILVQKLEDPESFTENLDRPSPVSVLEPFFSEETNSPERTTDQDALTAGARKLRFEEIDDYQPVLTLRVSEGDALTCTSDKEMKLKYVRSVLKASCLNYNKVTERWQWSDQLLDPFVYDEVEVVYGQLIDDSKLLFDCINKILVDIRDRYSSKSPWMSLKPNIRPAPTGENFVHEVCKDVEQRLQPVSPYTLDRVLQKDLEGGTWMNVWLETEGAVFDIGEVILEYIMEETILELYE